MEEDEFCEPFYEDRILEEDAGSKPTALDWAWAEAEPTVWRDVRAGDYFLVGASERICRRVERWGNSVYPVTGVQQIAVEEHLELGVFKTGDTARVYCYDGDTQDCGSQIATQIVIVT